MYWSLMKFIIKLVLVNFILLKLFLISFNGTSRNSAKSINAKKIVVSEGLMLFKVLILFSSNPRIIAPNISSGSNFSMKSIYLPFLLTCGL